MSRWDILYRINGLYVGQLDEFELAAFEQACRNHDATRSFDGPGGLFGLAKVKLLKDHCGDRP